MQYSYDELMRANVLLAAWLGGALAADVPVSIADLREVWEASKMQARAEASRSAT